jgi:hypothetical protein
MLTLSGNGRLTRDVELRSTRSGDSATVSVASDHRDRRADRALRRPDPRARPGRGGRRALGQGQAVAFSGRFERLENELLQRLSDVGERREANSYITATLWFRMLGAALHVRHRPGRGRLISRPEVHADA